MDTNFILPFIKATRNVFETMLQMPVTVGNPSVKKTNEPAHDVSAIISMSGDLEGTVVLSFPLDTARRVVAVFTGSEAAMPHEELSDAVGELVNMIAGGAKAQFTGKNVSISCPSVVIGQGHSVFGAKDVVSVGIPCSCDCGEFAVEVGTRQSRSSSAGVQAAVQTA